MLGPCDGHRRRRNTGLLVVLLSIPLLLPAATAVGPLGLDAVFGPGDDGSTPGPATERAAGTYAVHFECPDVGNDAVGRPEQLCPLYVLDQHDVMGQPVLMVDPDRADQLAFNALHGGRGLSELPGQDPPTDRSRDNDVHQPHTTFRTIDAGTTWEDMPYYAPDGLSADDHRVFGLDNAATLDGDGNVVLASLYAVTERQAVPLSTRGEASYEYALGLWKSGPVSSPIDYHAGIAVLPLTEETDAVVSSVYATHVPELGLTLVTWHEDAQGVARLRAITSPDGRGAIWEPLQLSGQATDCASVSGPIAQGREVWFACEPGEAFPMPANATDGLQVLALDVETGSVRYHSTAGIPGGSPLLVGRGEHGHVVALTTEVDDAGAPHVHIAYGDPLGRWGSVADLGSEISLAAAGVPVELARVTAAIHRPDSGNLHLIYMERTSGSLSDASRPVYTKAFVALKAEGDIMAVEDLEVGRISRADLTGAAADAQLRVLDDLHDGLVLWHHPNTDQVREFVAFADHGLVRFAEVTEENAGLPLIALGPGVPAVPVAAGTAAPVLAGAGAGVLASAMVLRMLQARRANAAASEVEK